MKQFKKISLLLLFILFPLYAESIILDDGHILKREIHSMDMNYIYCKNPDGTEEKISRDKVIRVVYKDIKKEDLHEILTEEEKKKIEARKDAKIKELERLKKLNEEEKEKKKELAEKKRLEEEKLRKSKTKNELIKSLSDKDKEIDRLRESERQKDLQIAKLEEQIQKLEEEIKETNAVLESTKKELAEPNKELISAKKEIEDLKSKLAKQKEEAVWSVVGRSAILPGWGHFYLKKDTTGYIYAGLFWGSFLFTFYNYNQSNSAKKEYGNTPVIPTQEGIAAGYFLMDQKYSQYAQSQQKLNQSFSLLFIVYVVQLTHAYFSGKEFVKDTSIGFRTFDSSYTSGNAFTPNRNYELYYQFRF